MDFDRNVFPKREAWTFKRPTLSFGKSEPIEPRVLDTFSQKALDGWQKLSQLRAQEVILTTDPLAALERDIAALSKAQERDHEKELQKDKKARAINELATELSAAIPLRCIEGRLFGYAAPIWNPITKESLPAFVRKHTEGKFDYSAFSQSTFSSLYYALLAKPELLLDPLDFRPRPGYVAFRDALLEISSGRILPPSPGFYLRHCLNLSASVISDTSLSAPIFEHFMEQMESCGGPCRQLFLEILGTLLSTDRPKKFFTFCGKSDTGKSQLAAFVRSLMGDRACVALSGLNDLRNRFALSRLDSKALAIANDLPNELLTSNAVSAIKQVSGDTVIKIEEKGVQARDMVVTAKLLVVTNHPLSVSDPSHEDAFFRRQVVLPFCYQASPEERIPDLAAALLEEAPYIVQEACKALRQLHARSFEFTYVEIPSDDLWLDTEFQQASLSGTVSRFLANACVYESGSTITTERLYRAYMASCDQYGWPTVEANAFSRELNRQVAPHGAVGKRINELPGRPRGYIGIKLTEEEF